jgi:hypothetical protein
VYAVTKAQKLTDLRRTARKLERIEKQAEIVRTERNLQIFEAVTEGATEREAAEAGMVGPSYAHRCVQYQGAPVSGPKLPNAA